ncbi:MAG: MarR family transcriptional regulator [Gammaproteobacteria bacterium]|nr:MarR family transcriptional regulator [Gammaproteobacteria bacterium]
MAIDSIMVNSKTLEILAGLRSIERWLALILTDTGLTVSQFKLLHQIAVRAPVTASVLSRELGVTKASITTQLQELDKAGSITLERNPEDRRSSLISLSDRGQIRMKVTMDNILNSEKQTGDKMLIAVLDNLQQLTQRINKGENK